MPSDIHFISVSKRGELVARRKGVAPVLVATAAEGLLVALDEDVLARGVTPPVRIVFKGGGMGRTFTCSRS